MAAEQVTERSPHQPELSRKAQLPLDSPNGVSKDLRTSEEIDSIRQYQKELKQIPPLTPEQEVEFAKEIEKGRAAKGQLESGTSLSSEEKQALELAVKKGDQAHDELVAHNLRLVFKIALLYTSSPNKNPTLSLQDLIQEGNLGLMRAVKKFDPHLGYRLSTYASRWIRERMSHAIKTQRTIKLPPDIIERSPLLLDATAALTQEHSDTQIAEQPEEIAAWIERTTGEKITPAQVHAWQKALNTTSIHLSHKIRGDYDSELALADIIPDTNEGENPERLGIMASLHSDLTQTLSCLDQRERTVIDRRFGLPKYPERQAKKPATLEQTGKEIGFTKEGIRQIEAKALRKLRSTAPHLKSYLEP